MTSNNVALIGIRQSTFTMTISLGLHYYQVTHSHIEAYPHSDQVMKHSPFGKIPILLVPDRHDAMIETMVMRTYLDHTYSKSSLTSLTPAEFEKQLAINFWISIVSDHLFKAFMTTMLPRMKGNSNPKGDSVVVEKKIASRVKRVIHLLNVMDAQLEKQRTQFATDICLLGGDTQPTWADFYMYPILRSLFQTAPESLVYRTHAPSMYSWYQRFGTTDWVRQAYNNSSSL